MLDNKTLNQIEKLKNKFFSNLEKIKELEEKSIFQECDFLLNSYDIIKVEKKEELELICTHDAGYDYNQSMMISDSLKILPLHLKEENPDHQKLKELAQSMLNIISKNTNDIKDMHNMIQSLINENRNLNIDLKSTILNAKPELKNLTEIILYRLTNKNGIFYSTNGLNISVLIEIFNDLFKPIVSEQRNEESYKLIFESEFKSKDEFKSFLFNNEQIKLLNSHYNKHIIGVNFKKLELNFYNYDKFITI